MSLASRGRRRAHGGLAGPALPATTTTELWARKAVMFHVNPYIHWGYILTRCRSRTPPSGHVETVRGATLRAIPEQAATKEDALPRPPTPSTFEHRGRELQFRLTPEHQQANVTTPAGDTAA